MTVKEAIAKLEKMPLTAELVEYVDDSLWPVSFEPELMFGQHVHVEWSPGQVGMDKRHVPMVAVI